MRPDGLIARLCTHCHVSDVPRACILCPQFLQERRKTEVADVERKFLMDKALLQERLERQREQIILEARAEAENGLHAKTRQIWLDNKRYGD